MKKKSDLVSSANSSYADDTTLDSSIELQDPITETESNFKTNRVRQFFVRLLHLWTRCHYTLLNRLTKQRHLQTFISRVLVGLAALILLTCVSYRVVHSGNGTDVINSSLREHLRESADNSAGSYIDILSWKPKKVNSRKELLSTDITTEIKRRLKSFNSPLNRRVLTQDYLKSYITGYVANLDGDFTSKKEKEHRHKRMDNGDDQALSKRSDFRDIELDNHQGYETEVTCDDLAASGYIERSVEVKLLEDDLVQCRRDMLRRNNYLHKMMTEEDGDDSEKEIVKKLWSRFGGSAVWLEKEECYVVYSRLIYSSRNSRGAPRFSLIRGQAFDRDWNELKGKRIPYNDVEIPLDLSRDLSQLDNELGSNMCKALNPGTEAYEKCQTDVLNAKLKLEETKEEIISRYYVTYPTVFETPFRPTGFFKGPEDPKVILKRNKYVEEPIVVYNIDDDVVKSRKMFAFHPHRKSDPYVRLLLENHPMRHSEKNWTPFFQDNIEESRLSRGWIYFVYTFFPLEIMRCSLNDGSCNMIFQGETIGTTKDIDFGGMRGGTQYVKLPGVLPELEGKHIWLGFPKLHISGCGCGGQFYRPMLSILVESNGVYYQELMVPAFTFDYDVLSWSLEGTQCKGTNIMSPNSIAYWEVVGQNLKTGYYEDYLGLTVSEADYTTRIMELRGVLNYVLKAYREKHIKETFEVDKESTLIISQTLKCLTRDSKQICAAYGKAHPE